MKKQYLEAGQIVATHGIAGEVRVKSWCDSNDVLCTLDTLYFDDKGKKPVKVLNARVHKNIVIMKLEGTDTMNDAQALRNKVLYLNRDELSLDEGTYFIQDLLGMKVVDKDDNTLYGELVDVGSYGANDVYFVKSPEGKTYLIPAIESVVNEINFENDTITITRLEGLFDD